MKLGAAIKNCGFQIENESNKLKTDKNVNVTQMCEAYCYLCATQNSNHIYKEP